ncbi:kinase-like protein [Exidia glandulosa HHB12029]|uniref:Kinase-like protein n=1 Tax=Exidia glandulosa HHB12029 TaxID=1314781 RepID=A0A165DGK0_EXIGL|nr:kinase-like protein [Exidia glandulosa HHB12029]
MWLKARGNENILHYIGTVQLTVYNEATSLWLISPYMRNGDLNAVLSDPSRRHLCDQEHVERYLGQVLSGLAFLHSPTVGIVHGDIKADNIYITDAENAVIADFGLSRNLERQDGDMTTALEIRTYGNFRTIAPEHLVHGVKVHGEVIPRLSSTAPALKLEPLSKSIANDIWGTGMLILHMFSRTVPWTQVKNLAEVTELASAGLRPPFPGHDAVRRGLGFLKWRLCHDCWNQLPALRPSAKVLLRLLHDGAQELLPATILDIDAAIACEVPELTSQIRAMGTPVRRSGYDLLPGLWRPNEMEGRGIEVMLLRREDSIRAQGVSSTSSFKDELLHWKRVCHDNLLALHGRCFISGMWFAVHDDLDCFEDWIAKIDRAGSDEEEGISVRVALLKLLYDIASALEFLHMQTPPIVHGDVQLRHVYIGKPRSTKLVLVRYTQYARLGGFAHMRSLQAGSSDGSPLVWDDVQAFGHLLRKVLEHRFGFSPGLGNDLPDVPNEAALIHDGCVRRFMSISQARDRLRELIASLSSEEM